MPGQTIAEAYVTIRPDLGSFRAELSADVRNAVEGATASVNIGADTSSASRSIDELRAKIDALRTQAASAKVNVDDTGARAKLDDLTARLDVFARKAATADLTIRDVAEVDAELATVQAELDRIDGRTATAHVRVDGADTAARDAAAAGGATGGFSAALFGLGGAAAAAVAALAPAVGILGTLPGVLAGAGAGVGAVVLGFSGIKNAMTALDKQQQVSSANTGTSARSAANAVISASNQVRNAEESLAQTRRTTGQQEISADEAVARAREQLGQTEQQVADQRVQAAQRVQDAEYSLTQANQQAAAAQQALNDAREQAARDLEDAANRQADAQINAQQATLDLTTAQQNYDQVMNSSTATDAQKRQAFIDLERAQQRLAEAQTEAQRATEDNTKAQQAGVDGSQRVISAGQQVVNAKHSQEIATRSLTDAEHAQVEAEVNGAQKITDAERAVTDALRAQVNSREQARYQIMQGEQSLADAQRNLAAASATATAGSSAAQTAARNAQEAMAKLSPAGRSFVEFLRGLEPQLRSLKATAQTNLFPGLESGIRGLMQAFPVFRDAIGQAASGIGDFLSQLGNLVGSSAFSHDLASIFSTNNQLMDAWGQALLSIIDALRNVAVAAEPLTRWLATTVRAWGQHLDVMSRVARQSGALGSFFTATQQALHLIGQLVGTIASTLGTFIRAFAPVGRTVLEFVNTTLQDLGPLITNLGQALQPVIQTLANALLPILPGLVQLFGQLVNLVGPLLTAAIHVIAPLLPTLVTALNQILTALHPLLPVITRFITQMGTELVKALQMLISNLVQLFQAVAPLLPPIVQLVTEGLTPLLRILTPIINAFLHLVNGVIRDVVVPAIRDVVMPVLSAFVYALTHLGDAAKWLWHNAIEPAFDGIKTVITGAWEDVIRPTLKFIVDAFFTMAGGIIHAADDAFGWVPFLGGKLDSAAKHFDEFRDSVNASLSGIHSKVISVELASAGQAVGRTMTDFGQFLVNLGKTPPARGHADGGRIVGPGGPRSDVIPALVSNGEYIVNAASTARFLPLLESINTAGRYADGGVITTTPGVPNPAAASWGHFLDSIADRVTLNVSLNLPGTAGGPMNVSGGAKHWLPQVLDALRLLNLPSSLAQGALNILSHESGGDPTNVNRTDINWQEGHPSVGLMQVIAGTFDAYAGPFRSTGPFMYGVSTDPLANIYAGLNYALHRYGAGMIAAGGRHDPSGGYIGYDTGGVLWPGTRAVNNTTRPELVLSPEQTQAISNLDPTVADLLRQISYQLDTQTSAWLKAVRQIGPDVGSAMGSAVSTAKYRSSARVT